LFALDAARLRDTVYTLCEHIATGFEGNKIGRRNFILAGLAATVGASAQTTRLETLTQWLHASRKTRELALQPCLDLIRELDTSIHAWVQVLPQRPTGDGKLSEIPFGAKDIIETRGLSTEYGSPVYKGRIGTADAAIVRDLRARGAILLGKTHTTAFAYRTPAPTRNPLDLEHTPGGSSSGSAAAVATGMVPFALGTQTLGSVLRPASYCGVTGFKGSYGLVSMEGVLGFAKSLDTLGYFTNTPTDMLALWELMGHPPGQSEQFAFGAPEPIPDVEPEMAAAFRNGLTRIRAAGVTVRTIDIAGMLSKLADAANTVMFYEGARFHEQRYKEYGARLADLADLVRDGMQIPAQRYDDARHYIAECQATISEIYKATPVIVVPAATGPAPLGLASTGDPSMNAPWTALGTPAISIPMPVPGKLLLGFQLTADHGEDARVLRAAVRIHGILSSI
jgi:Asp-tRNA(Asn)/Glu-tRNA(Gln) amidotransferase A subunit family amidase